MQCADDMASLIEKIRHAVTRNPQAPAFIYSDHVLSFRQMFALLCVTAKIFYDAGIRPSHTVGLSMPQSPLHCIAMLALARLGANFVPIPYTLATEYKNALIKKYGIWQFVSNSDDGIPPGLRLIKLDSVSVEGNESDLDFIDYVPDLNTPLRIAMSSGTTGEPKGLMNSHGYVIDRIEKTLYECDASSRLIAPDLHMTVGFIFAVGVLCRGGTVVFPRSYDLPELAVAINLHAVTHILLSPAIAALMADQLPDGGINFPSLKHLRIVGSTPSRYLLETMRNKFSSSIYVPYGLTEVGVVSLATPDSLLVHPESAGKIVPWAQVEILDPEGRVLPAEETGEVRIMVDGMPERYYHDEEQSKLKFKDGWFHPGDLGHISGDGLLFIDGRMDDILNLGGHKVSPSHIESVLNRHPAVRESIAFILVTDPGREVMAAAVIPNESRAIGTELGDYCRQTLQILAPEQFFLVDDFPRNRSGKVLRSEIPAIAAKMLSGETKTAKVW